MKIEQLDQISAALANHAEASIAANRRLFAEIRAVKGGEALLRETFAQANLDDAAVARIINGQAQAGDMLCMAYLKLGRKAQ